jgi:hypothetical protein
MGEVVKMSLDLSPEVENIVRERAKAEGASVDELLARTYLHKDETAQAIIDPKARVLAKLAKWQTDEKTPQVPPIEVLPGESQMDALFRKWQMEDANMTDTEVRADEAFWQDFQSSIDAG